MNQTEYLRTQITDAVSEIRRQIERIDEIQTALGADSDRTPRFFFMDAVEREWELRPTAAMAKADAKAAIDASLDPDGWTKEDDDMRRIMWGIVIEQAVVTYAEARPPVPEWMEQDESLDTEDQSSERIDFDCEWGGDFDVRIQYGLAAFGTPSIGVENLKPGEEAGVKA